MLILFDKCLNYFKQEKNASKLVAIFIILHVLAWTLYPIFAGWSLHEDMAENFAWGQEWQWGYYKHPPLFAWVTALYLNLTGIHLPNYFLLSQLNVALTFLAVWILAKEVLPMKRALVALLILECIPCYTFLSIKLNANSICLPTWAWTITFTYLAVNKNKLPYWIGLGALAGLSMLGKYFSVVLLVAIFIYLLSTPQSRKYFKTWGPYVSLLMFLAIFGLHLAWMVSNDFQTIHYGIQKTTAASPLRGRLDGLSFLAAQAAYLSLAFALMCFILKDFKLYKMLFAFNSGNPQTRFLWFVTVLPCALCTGGFVLLGTRSSSVWGIPMWSTFGILALSYSTHALEPKRLGFTYKGIFAFLFVVALIIAPISRLVEDEMSPDYPHLAKAIEDLWLQNTKTELKYIAAPYPLAETLSFYSDKHPSALIDFNPQWTPWIGPEQIKQYGIAVIMPEGDAQSLEKAQNLYGKHPTYTLNIAKKAHASSKEIPQQYVYMIVPPKGKKA